MLLELVHRRERLTSDPRGPARFNLHIRPRLPVAALSPSAFGAIDEYPYWNAVFELYRKDELSEAFQLMERIGIGMFGDYALAGDIVYLESATSSESEIVRLDAHFEVEFIREQLPFGFEDMAKELLSSSAKVYSDFGIAEPATDVLLTLLVKDAVISSHNLQQGYFTPKSKYTKICLPMPKDLTDVASAFRRELSSSLAFELSKGRAELWLLEAATVVAGSGSPQSSTANLDEVGLNDVLSESSDEPEFAAQAESARAQCNRIGHFLLAHGGLDRFVQCLKAHELAGSTGRAVKEVYGFPADELFSANLTRSG